MFHELAKRWTWVDLLLGVGLGLVTVGIGLSVKDSWGSKTGLTLSQKITPTATVTVAQVYSKVMIDVGGAVIKPGVYELTSDSRIAEALVAAGGLAATADREWVEKNVNRAEKVIDGMKIYIPSINDQVQMSNDKLVTNKSDLIHLNSATAAELDTLPGIGPAIAQRIIDYRQKNGGFKTVDEIKLVAGVGAKLYEQIKEKIGL